MHSCLALRPTFVSGLVVEVKGVMIPLELLARILGFLVQFVTVLVSQLVCLVFLDWKGVAVGAAALGVWLLFMFVGVVIDILQLFELFQPLLHLVDISMLRRARTSRKCAFASTELSLCRRSAWASADQHSGYITNLFTGLIIFTLALILIAENDLVLLGVWAMVVALAISLRALYDSES